MTKMESSSSPISSVDMTQQMLKRESFSNQNTPTNMPPEMQQLGPQQNGVPFNPAINPQYFPSPATIYTYPAGYGSFENPLHHSTWMAHVRANGYAAQPLPGSAFTVPYAPTLAGTPETVHACGCGDGCQCIGCVAHPYNDATQEAIHKMMLQQELPPNGITANGNGAGSQIQGTDASSPTTQTPLSNGDGDGDGEQTLDPGDFLFVSYSFCAGDTSSCPCGDDCECEGCDIHNKPQACYGANEYCPCGDDCQCVGCEQHNGSSTTLAS